MAEDDHPLAVAATVLGAPTVGALAGGLAEIVAADSGTSVEGDAVGLILTGLGWTAGGVYLVQGQNHDGIQFIVGCLGLFVGPMTAVVGLFSV